MARTGWPWDYQQRHGLDIGCLRTDGGRMPTRKYGAATTAAEIVDDVDLHGRRVVVTGASSGIGVETARALASAGADVTLAVRNVEAGARVADEIGAGLPPGSAA